MPPYCLAMLFLLPWRSTRIRMGNRYSQIIGPILIFVTGTKIKISGKEHLNPKRPAIYLNNHSSGLDPLIAMSICPVGGCGIAKKQLAYIPFLDRFIGCLDIFSSIVPIVKAPSHRSKKSRRSSTKIY